MKILIDANLSPKLVPHLEDSFPGSQHVFTTELVPSALDVDIWNFARDNDYALLLSFDEDMKLLCERFGPPPKVILLRMYNQRRREVREFILSKLAGITQFLGDETLDVLELRKLS